jgi:hypothetical protein
MNPPARITLVLEQYQCRRCGRLFYINAMDRSLMDFDFGCPYGCDDNGRHVRDIKTQVSEVNEARQKNNEGDD